MSEIKMLGDPAHPDKWEALRPQRTFHETEEDED
jgi:hypothetical protein